MKKKPAKRGLLGRRNRRRGAILLELVMTVPFSIILVFLSVDIGRYVLVKSSLHDAAAVAARAGARTGALGPNPSAVTPLDCTSTGANRQVQNAFCEATENLPGISAKDISWDVKLYNSAGASRDGEFCESDGGFIYTKTDATAKMTFLLDTLPLDEMLGLENGLLGGLLARGVPADMRGPGVVMHVSATARCEVAR